MEPLPGYRRKILDKLARCAGMDDIADRIVVERPFALGREMDLHDGAPLVGLFTVGQNRWMFRTRVKGHGEHSERGRDAISSSSIVRSPAGGMQS